MTLPLPWPYLPGADPVSSPEFQRRVQENFDKIATSVLAISDIPRYAPGAVVGYDEITSNVTVSSGTEATGTTVISCAAHTFDGSPHWVEFFSAAITPGDDDQVIVCLFEGATEITRLCKVGTAGSGVTVFETFGYGKVKFTPSSGSHTYTVKAFRITNDGLVNAGSAGGTNWPPAFCCFTKV